MTDSGDIVANYNNGQSQTIAQVPVVTFADSDALQRQNGQAFTATAASGDPIAQAADTNGAGSLVTGSVESSNVDIATEFSKLIVAQQAYSANAKMVTTADRHAANHDQHEDLERRGRGAIMLNLDAVTVDCRQRGGQYQHPARPGVAQCRQRRNGQLLRRKPRPSRN